MDRPIKPASPALPYILLGMSLALAGADLAWALAGSFEIAGRSYGFLAGLTALLWAVGFYYQERRGEPDLAAMLFGAAFLIGFSAAASVFNTFLLTVAGASIDGWLAEMDRAMGFDWPALMARMADYPVANNFLKLAYNSVLPQIALAVIVLGWRRKSESIYSLCLAIAFGAITVISIWTCFPSFGAMAVYALPPDIAARLDVALDGDYGQALVRMLADGPGLISPQNMKGLIGFPSYHIVLALLVAWYLRDVPYLRWVIFGLNFFVIVATPIQGGHHWIDVLAGVPVAVCVIVMAEQVMKRAARYSRARWLDSLCESASEVQ